jgi:hypothetical protein
MVLVNHQSDASDESEESTSDWSAKDDDTGTPKRKAPSHTTKSLKHQKLGGEHILEVQMNVS